MLGHLLCHEVWLLRAATAQMQLRLNDMQKITVEEAPANAAWVNLILVHEVLRDCHGSRHNILLVLEERHRSLQVDSNEAIAIKCETHDSSSSCLYLTQPNSVLPSGNIVMFFQLCLINLQQM